jgi:GTP-binding nuclear protein Ran
MITVISTLMSGVEIIDAAFKITLVGDGGVGKTTFLRRHETVQFEPRYIATESRGLSACPLRRPTRTGRHVVYNVWDGAGQEKYDSRRATSTWAGTDAFLVMFDLTNLSSYQNARWWIQQVLTSHPTVPIVLVGMKSESPARKLAFSQVTLHSRFGLPYVEVSAKNNAIAAPFECLERLFVESIG